MSSTLKREEGGLVNLVLESKPVNSLTKDLLKNIAQSVREAESDPAVTTLILSSSCRVFSAGGGT